MDRSLKERLIGAAVLVALGVWLIPWVLDGPDSDDTAVEEPIALELPVPATGEAPSRGEPIRRQTIELNVDRRPPAGEIAPEGPAAVNTEPTGDAQAPAAEETKPAPSTASTPSQSRPSPEPAAVAATPPVRQSPAPAAPAVSVSRNVPTDGWMVQLGSFGDSANAQRQAERIRTFGHDPRIYEFTASGRLMYRVRVGPMDTRERAEATASALSAHGFVAQVVAPD